MSKSEIKELAIFIILSIINIIISFAITNFLGITNTVVFKTLSLIYGDITWEVIIFMGLSLIAGFIIEYSNKMQHLIYE